MVAEQIVLDALREWVRKLGFGSFDKVAVRGLEHQPQFGQFNWDLTAPTYLFPFVRHGEGIRSSPGFFVADVLLGRALTQEQVRYFVNKATIMRRQRKTRPFLGLLLADHYAPEAFKLGRTEGLIFTTPDVLFGTGISAALRELIQTLRNAAAVAVKNPDVVHDLFAKLGRLEGAALNLRGPLFEMILAYCFRREGSVDIGVSVRDPDTGEPAEIDVLVKASTVVRVCECKGYSRNMVDIDEIKDWLDVRVPRIRRYLRNNDYFKKFPLQFEFWISGEFTAAALGYLRTRKREAVKYQIDWKDGEALRRYVDQLDEPYVLRVLDEHYFRHPLLRLIAPSSRAARTNISPLVAP